MSDEEVHIMYAVYSVQFTEQYTVHTYSTYTGVADIPNYYPFAIPTNCQKKKVIGLRTFLPLLTSPCYHFIGRIVKEFSSTAYKNELRVKMEIIYEQLQTIYKNRRQADLR